MRTATWPEHEHIHASMARRGAHLTKRYWMFLTICQAASTPRPDGDSRRGPRNSNPDSRQCPSVEQ